MALNPSLADKAGQSAVGAVLRLSLSDTRQLFNSMDPAPFQERDLDPKAVDYIVDWGREAPAGLALRLEVLLGQPSASADDASVLREAVHEYFRRRALATRRQVRQLFRIGRISLLIGVVFVAVAAAAAESMAGLIPVERYAMLVRESLVIGGWVALWRPMEIFLYDWWPLSAEARLYDRLSQVELHVLTGASQAQGA